MTSAEKAAVLFAKGFNCSQAVLSAFCEEEGLSTERALKLASGLGGGVRCGDVCGAVTGAIMAIGLKCGFCTEGDTVGKAYCYHRTQEFLDAFTAEFGSVICRELLGVDIRTGDDHQTQAAKDARVGLCPNLVAGAARIVDHMASLE